MVNLHRTTSNIIRKLRALNPVHLGAPKVCCVRDDAMSPFLEKGDIVPIDIGSMARHGVLIAIATDEFVDIRELQIHNDEFYLIASNPKFPRISMPDYRVLYPGAYFCGVVH